MTDDGTMTDDVDEPSTADGLRATDLIPIEGGEWRGLLFDNPRIGLAPRLTWTFTFPFQEFVRGRGGSAVELTVDWIPLAAASWRAMTGLAARSTSFAEGGEASVYFYEHHRYNSISLDLLAQDDLMLRARTTVTGDMDRLGLESITTEAWLRFTGITVALSDRPAADAALSRLRAFIDTAGLSPTPVPQHNNLRFVATTT